MKLFHKKEVWVPAVPGLISILLLFGLLVFGLFFRLYPFLAKSHPLPQAELVIVEGWVPDAEIAEILKMIGPDQIVITSGGPITFCQKIMQYNTYAELGAARLVEGGIAPERILTVSAPPTDRDRTYISALAVRKRLQEEGLFGKPAELYSVGAHARRSYLLFRRAFGREYPLGVTSIAPVSYDMDRWYFHSVGVRHVTEEPIAWIYAKFFMLGPG